MRIMVIDDDTSGTPQMCDGFRQMGHVVDHVKTVLDVEVRIAKFLPEGIILDLMMPAMGLPSSDCNGGYTSGAYIYRTVIAVRCPKVPFIVLSGADLRTSTMTRAIEELKRYSSYRGTIAKICDEEKMVAMLAGQREGGNQ